MWEKRKIIFLCSFFFKYKFTVNKENGSNSFQEFKIFEAFVQTMLSNLKTFKKFNLWRPKFAQVLQPN